MKKFTLIIAAALLAAPLAYADHCTPEHREAKADKAEATMTSAKAKAEKSIVETASTTDGFSTLVTAVKAAGLVDALSGDGPFTVFAPTDEAFAAIPEAKLKALLADKEALTKVLTYHVVAGNVKAADVVKLDKAETLNGQSVTIKAADDKVMVDGANVVATDIACSNGTIHVIDKVILPENLN
jgi:uncharacterized surface protein with fasciclin (FAS1) repeats